MTNSIFNLTFQMIFMYNQLSDG